MSDTIEELPIIFSESAALKVKDLIAEENRKRINAASIYSGRAALAFNMVLLLMNQRKRVTLWLRKMG